MAYINEIITEEKLSKILPKLTQSQIKDWVEVFRAVCSEYNLITSNRVASFIGQAIHESQGLKLLEENLNYTSAERLIKIFPNDFVDLEDAKKYVGKPEEIANRVYANQGGNGDEASGDGWKHRGRGIGQLTLKENYMKYFAYKGLDLLTSPDIVSTKKYAADSFGWFFRKNRLYSLCDKWDIKGLSKKINGGRTGLDERILICNRVRQILMYGG